MYKVAPKNPRYLINLFISKYVPIIFRYYYTLVHLNIVYKINK